MIYSLNKVLAAMTVALIAATHVASAATYIQQPCDPCAPFQDCDPCAPCSPCATCPCTHPIINGCGNWFGEIDVLYWKAAECGLTFASSSTSSTVGTGPSGATTVVTKINNPTFKWDVGVRVGLGYAFASCWDASIYYTHFNSRARGSLHNDGFEDTNTVIFAAYGTENGMSDTGDPFVEPAKPGATIGDQAHDILGKWNVHLDYADLEMGREFCIGTCITMRPFVSVRAAWTEQKYHIFSSVPGTGGGTATFATQDVELKSEFKGAGLRSGFDTEWHIGCGFSLYSTAAISILYGRGKSVSEEVNRPVAPLPELPGGVGALTTYQSDSWLGCRAIADLGIGFRFRQFFCCDTVLLNLGLGWEQHMFLNENRFEDFAHKSPPPTGAFVPLLSVDRSPQFTRGDLCVQGWTFSGKVEF